MAQNSVQSSHLISGNVCTLFPYQYLIITQLTDLW